jgi:transposase
LGNGTESIITPYRRLEVYRFSFHLLEVFMKFVGIDLHTNRFTCCYLSDNPKEKQTETFELDSAGLKKFYSTIDMDTYVLIEATVNTFSFAALFKGMVKEVVIANTYQLKSTGVVSNKTDKIDAFKLAEKLKAQVISGVQQIVPVTVPPKEIRDLRAFFSTCRILRKEIGQTKNRIHSLLKENLYPFTKEYIFGKKARIEIRNISSDHALSFQINMLMDTLEHLEEEFEKLEVEVLKSGSLFMPQIEILTSMTGVSVITAIAVVADIIDVSRFRNSKHFASYLRSAPTVESSNNKTVIKSTNKAGRKLSITFLSQSLNHFRDNNETLSQFYEKSKVFKKKGVIRMALCRRVITQIYQMLKKGEYHYFCNTVLHEKKLAEYRKFLKKENISFLQNSKSVA